jgi:hypothetical protein
MVRVAKRVPQSMARRTTPDGTDNFDVELVSNIRGYISATDPTLADPAILSEGSQNVYIKNSDTVANRPGRKLYDAVTDPTIAGVKGARVWNTSLGATFIVQCVNGVLRFYSTISGTGTWYNLLTGLTLTRFVFDTYWDNTDKKDKLLMVNGDTSKVYNWAGGLALFVSATPTVITLDRNAATAGFASSGTVTINANTYTYSGISGSTLTGTESSAAGEAANSVVFSQIITTTSFTSGPGSTYACDFIRVVTNQLYLGSYTSQLVYLSKNTDYKDMSFGTPRLTGEGDTILLDAPGKGIGISGGAAHIFYGTANLAKITFNQITVGTTLSEQVLIGKVPLGENVSAQAHEFINSLSDNIIYLDQANQLRSFGIFRNLATTKSVLLSQAVQIELAQETFTLGDLAIVSDRRGDIVYISAPNSSKTYVYQERSSVDAQGVVSAERIWQPPQLWGVSRITAIGGRTIGFSNANPQTYYLWDTGQWFDDSPSGQLPYQSIALFSYQDGGRRQGKVHFEKIYTEGYITTGTTLMAGIYYDYQGATALLTTVLNSPSSPLISGQQLFTGVTPPSLGDASLGDNPLGDGLNVLSDDQSQVPKFRVINGMTLTDCYEFAIMYYSSIAGDRWEILAFGANVSLSAMQGSELVKQN